MKKVKNCILFLAIFALITIVFVLSNNAMAKTEKKKESKISYVDIDSNEFNETIEDALKKEYGTDYKKIVEKNAHSASLATKIDLKYLNSNTGEINYPLDFGGQYINSDNELVVQIVKNKTKSNSIKSLASTISEEIKYEYVDNSYSDLENINNKIIEYFSNEKSINKGLKANYVDVINNIVVVELKNNNEEEQNWFKENVIDSKLIKFIKNKGDNITTATYNAGGEINGWCSIGYRVKRSGKQGFITAAHCYSDNANISGFGKVTYRKYDDTNGLDGEFVELSSGNTVTNNLQWGSYPSTSINTATYPYFGATVGQIVAKSGWKTKATSGTIKNVNFSGEYKDGGYFAKYVLTSALCNGGDSGGVVYKPGSPAVSAGAVVGIVHGKNCVDKDCIEPGPMMFSRSDWLDRELSLSRY